MKTIMVRNVPDDLHRELKVLAAKTDSSINGLILEMIREVLLIARSGKLDEARKALHDILDIPVIRSPGTGKD